MREFKDELIKKYRLDGIQKKKPTPQPIAQEGAEPLAVPTPPPVIIEYQEDEAIQKEPEQLPPAKQKNTSLLAQALLVVAGVFLFSFAPIQLFELSQVITAKAQTNDQRFAGLVQSIRDRDYLSAQTYITLINQDLATLDQEFIRAGQKNVFLNTYLPVQDYSATAENIFSIINDSSQIARDITPLMYYFSNLKTTDLEDDVIRQEIEGKLTQLQIAIRDHRPALERLSLQMNRIDTDKIPDNLRESFVEVRTQATEALGFFDTADQLITYLPRYLGIFYDQKYLLLFQNNTELRATGGFIGSYGIATVRDAQLADIFIDSIYNPDGQMSKQLTPPVPLQKITDSWAMRDANWSPDLPTAMERVLRMYELEGGFTPDGVVVIDTYPIIELLKIFGPIAVDDDTTIDADNFLRLTQFKTSIDIDESADNPKKFLSDLGPIMIDKIKQSDPDTQKQILSLIRNSVLEKHIQLYFPDKHIQNIIQSTGLDNAIKQTHTTDYFMYVNSNLGGMKTNHEITETVAHEITQDTKQYIHRATITRQHTGKDEWPSGINYAYMRFYLPENARLMEVSGLYSADSIGKNKDTGILYLKEDPTMVTPETIDRDTDHQKRVYGAWAVIAPGSEETISLTYTIPNRETYSLYIQKQAGIIQQMTTVSHNSVTYTTDLKTDYRYLENH